MTGNKMTEYQSHLQDVLDAPEGPHIGALFDFDGTIIAGYSATSMLWEKIRRGEMTAEQLVDGAPDWAHRDGHFWLIQFGKRICVARSPKCDICPVSDLCECYAAQQTEKELDK